MLQVNAAPTLFATAESYVRRGWHIIPVHFVTGPDNRCSCGRYPCHTRNSSAGKHPVGGGWQDRRMSAADVYGTWGPDGGDRRPWNIGILTGQPSGIWVLDIDPDNGGDVELTRLLAEHGPLPETYTVRTGSGGTHYYFRMPDFDVRNDQDDKIAPGIDVRGTGGQVVAAGSRSGKGIYTVISDAEVADAPQWLLDALMAVRRHASDRPPLPVIEDLPAYADLDPHTQERVQRYAQAALDSEVHRYTYAPNGRGNRALFEAACNVLEIIQSPWNLLTEDAAETALEAARVQRLANNPGHGQDAHEFEQTWKSARSRVVGQGRPLPADRDAGLMFDPFGNGAVSGANAGPDGAVGAEDRDMDPVDAMLAEMLDRDAVDSIEPPTPLIRDVLYLDSESWIIGAPGGFKSFVALDWAAHVARGMIWRGCPVEQGEVVYLVAEGKAGIGLRVKAWEKVYGERMEGVRFLPRPVQVRNPAVRGEPSHDWMVLVEACRRIKPKLIVIDTQARVTRGMDENDNGEMGTLVEAVRRLKVATGACVLVVHHTGRSGGDARGASAIDGAQDTELRVDRDGDRSLKATISIDKQKDGSDESEYPISMRIVDLGECPKTSRPLSSLALEPMSPFGVTVKPEPWREGLADNQLRIVTVLADHVDADGQTTSEIRRMIAERFGQEMNRSTFNTALGALKERGVVVTGSSSARWTLQSKRPEV